MDLLSPLLSGLFDLAHGDNISKNVMDSSLLEILLSEVTLELLFLSPSPPPQ